ncbi:MAG TPA: dTDP-glucose 4,6-dehydratase [Bacillota bacterium]|nr:dTDP-glucose 4,6-dehydratase [Bacillota bacterium]
MKLLVTGGAGFIGSNFIHYICREHPDWEIVILDKLTYAGSLKNVTGLDSGRCRFIKGDITDSKVVGEIAARGVDAVVNFAAESHVDRSIDDPAPFIENNIKGTQVLLEAARRHGLKKFVQVSTDEVYGSLGPEGKFDEGSPLAPNSPYSASKASADLLCRAYFQTYGLPVVITRCSNNFGPRQFPEKFIPVVITSAMSNRPVPLYGDGLNVRDWLYVTDHCRALEAVICGGREGEVYNIGGGRELTNLELAVLILKLMGKPADLVRYVKDRPGHDRRYSVDSGKIRRELGWRPVYGFEEALRETIRWYVANCDWWDVCG